MKLLDYLNALQNLVDNNPELADLDVIYTSDDEGNHVTYACSPSVVNWIPSENCFAGGEEGNHVEPAICVN